MTGALLLVDCQRLFLDPASPAVLPGARRAARAAGSLLASFRAAGRPVAHARFETRPGTPMARRWRPVRPGSPWAAYHGVLSPRPGEGDFLKHGYSAFRGTPLAAWLRRRGVRRVTVAGFMTDLCVLATALDAFDAGFAVRVPAAACAARTPSGHRRALAVVARACADVA